MRYQSKVTVGDIQVNPENWQTDRTISGSGVPGQTRTRIGALAGTATFNIINDNGRPFEIAAQTVGQTATIDATIDTDTQNAVRIFTGRTDGIDGTALAPTLDVSAIDNTRHDTPLTLPVRSELNGSDAAHIIALAARALGYQSWPDGEMVIPLHGDPAGVTGTQNWVNTPDGIGLDLSTAGTQVTRAGTPLFEVGDTHTITVTLTDLTAGATQLSPAEVYYHGATESVTYDSIAGRYVSQNATLASTSGQLIFETQFQRYFNNDIRSRSRMIDTTTGATSNWNTWRMTTYTPENIAVVKAETLGSPLWAARWVSLRAGTIGDSTFTPTARIGVSGIKLDALIVEKQTSAWAFIQNTTQHVMGASGITETGAFGFWGKDELRTGQPKEIIGVDGFADLKWRLSTDDVADRVEVTFTPPTISESGHHTVWEASEVVRLSAGQTRTLSFALEGVAARMYYDFEMALTDPMETTRSRWIAFSTTSGSSPVVDPTALRIEIETTSWNTGRIRITNTTSSTLWIRDVNGRPALTLRAQYIASFGDSETIGVGASKETALTPLTHDGGTTIQRHEDATLLAEWLFASLSTPQPVINSVSVLPDFRRRIGDIVTIYDPLATKIRAHCLIAGVHNTPTTQTLDLAMLAVTNDAALRYSETLAPEATTIGELFDAVDTNTPGATTISDLINSWEKESVVIA